MRENQNILVFSIALNGYQLLYRKFLDSHKNYAARHGYHYQAITRPYFTSMGVECCWLKLTLMQHALCQGYQAVMFIDADAFVHERAPNLENMLSNNAHIFMAKGYTDRFNSGVMVVKRGKCAEKWISDILADKNKPIEPHDSVGWGENGHIIKHAHNKSFIMEIDKRWNNTDQPAMDDYITHCNYGPLRRGFIINSVHKLLSRLTGLLAVINAWNTREHQAINRLSALTNRAISHSIKFKV